MVSDNDTDEELQNPENWDYDKAVVMEAIKRPRAVVSVSFSADDLDVVSEAAAKSGMKTSEYIRKAALDEAAGKPETATLELQGTSGGSYSVNMQFSPSTRGTATREDVGLEAISA